jgi:hypothetical protein
MGRNWACLILKMCCGVLEPTKMGATVSYFENPALGWAGVGRDDRGATNGVEGDVR